MWRCLAVLMAVAPFASAASGSFEPVELLAFQQTKDASFSLIAKASTAVTATRPAESYFSLCKQLRVFGSFDEKFWKDQSVVTRVGHLQALAALERAKRAGNSFQIGWLGRGLQVVNKSQPCVMKSRGLVLWKEPGVEAVLSVYHAL